ncbi:ATP phosphoribosyltransferase regulatory subunit [Paraliomyxa miuraensis]|uniref:ATP phosphoribosyltransferase regulatory subunit n=1 Tax=Paraliomyxa miuraensis TaxID=376150 RepID=UPI00224D321C|nr:ATP phosphoribosyltransferase regulatory subunit [Paraliomyxa miuraensis]MCX4242348.1 ATP phosphoribosyltransferase regulatory subunit [Paraliomyxa miuraensis]
MSDSTAGAIGGAPICALPRGARDLLPAACRRRRAITHTLLSTFEAWGYEPVATPAIEYYEVLSRGLSEADRRGCVRFIAAGSGDLVSLRADVTPQIARMLAQRWGGELPDDVVHRFSYAAEVLRQPTSAREQTEVHQVGIELIGDADPAADAELVALARAALRSVGLVDFRLDLAHTRVARGLLDALELPAGVAELAHAHLARKDRDGLARVLQSHEHPEALRRAAVALCDLFGEPARVLARAEVALRDAGVDDALAGLSATIDHLRRMDADVLSHVTVDLGEARGFDYYSGIRVRGWARGVHHPLVRGGRYDGLPRRYGVPRPATGLAIDLDAVEAGLAAQGDEVPGAEPGPAHLVVVVPADDASARAQAHAEAARARASGRRAWVQPGLSLPRAQALAEASGADRLTIVNERGATRWSREPHSWVLVEETT